MRISVGIILVLSVVLTAGCLGFGPDESDADPTVESPSNDTVEEADDDRDDGDDKEDEDRDTAGSDESDESDAPGNEESEPTDDAVDVPADVELPPGVDEDGIHDVRALLEANDAALSETGYEAEIRRHTHNQWVNSTTTQTFSVDAEGRMLSTHSTRSSSTNATQEYWLDGDAGYWFHETNGDRNYSVVSGDGIRSLIEPSTSLEPYLEVYAFDLAAVEDGRIVLEATNVSETDRSAVQIESENASATLVLDTEGRIHAFEHGYETGETGVEYSYRLEKTGDVALEEPAWTDDARDAATMVDLSIEREDGLLTISHEGGDVIENGTGVIVGTPAANETLGTIGEIGTDFEPGDTAYVANTGLTETSVTVGESPDVDADPFPKTELHVTILSDMEVVEILRVETE